ncbi:hypothetical protein [Pseudomonas sp. LS.1a]|uniref:hypothetical protein n=1 Tax=Pseudomonas sp. LS.1a TaxID=2920387 RepID=UPI001F13B1F7|nr:hypothetical protein [Pseudomonas sp. LS.1a]UMY59838.1 hypothetical protein MKK04_16580 [Pseudomonas sp. LS.1a]
MNEAQIERVRELVQEIATGESITFDEAFAGVMGLLREHTNHMPKGRTGAAGSGSAHSLYSQNAQSDTSATKTAATPGRE